MRKRVAYWWVLGLPVLIFSGCQTTPPDRDRAADEALTHPKPAKAPVPPNSDPRPEFKQEPPGSQ